MAATEYQSQTLTFHGHDNISSHGHDNISIRMLKICGLSICKPLEIIFRTCLNHGKFPEEWKKANVIPVLNKATNSVLKIIALYPCYQF